jgi:hypothetical protein
MAHRADTAETLHDHRNFRIHSSADELLKAAKFNDVEARSFHFPGGIELDRDFAVTFNPSDWINDDLASPGSRLYVVHECFRAF